MNLSYRAGRRPVRLASTATAIACAAAILAVCGVTPASASPQTSSPQAAAQPAAGSNVTESQAAAQPVVSPSKPRLLPGFVVNGKIKSFNDVSRLAESAAGRKQLQAYAAADGTTCADNVYIVSYANDLFVSAEVGWAGSRNGILRARASQVGPWELFRECWYLNSANKYVYSLQSQANNLWVSIEYNYTGTLYEVLRARAATAGEWEHFYRGESSPGQMNLQAVHLGRYVSVEVGNTGDDYAILRARATVLGPWELLGLS